MELIRSLHNLRDHHQKCVATIGNFDGIHLGHQAIISQLKEIAGKHDLPTVIITFEPQPQEYFSPGNAPARLTRLREKIEEMERLSVDRLICLRFNSELASLSPRDFVKRLLIEGLDIRHLVVGDDFRFGKDRQGDYATLEKMADEFGYQLEHTATCSFAGERISSTRIRQALANDDLNLARELLGRDYAISGRVVHGDKRGKSLGFPTANMELHRLHSPVAGVYVTRVHIMRRRQGADETIHPAVTSVGTRPMFDGEGMRLETHILDFDESLYAKHIRVVFLKKLRAEDNFSNVDDLIKAIATDIENARQYFSRKT
ncbi:MAG: bifunctional riboflavin kinase/FAD synthetase [Proteobacteria bacterium]|nr:bifunctional riboflavin kinase/FAD synthetase [Pseudomonadota bacterium]